MSEFRTLAFGDPESASWGVTWVSGAENPARLALSLGDRSEVVPVRLEGGAPEETWRLEGDGVSLGFRPLSALANGATDELSTADQLCAVAGRLQLGGTEAGVECLGWRSAARAGADLGGLDSLRFLAAWLDPGHGLLTSLRPRKARGQEADATVALVIDDRSPPQVDDPRLSTTYSDAGLPLRVGLELWLPEPSPSEAETSDSHQYPRRAAGETAGPGLDWDADGFDWHATLLRWHSHELEGPGVYVLGRRR